MDTEQHPVNQWGNATDRNIYLNSSRALKEEWRVLLERHYYRGHLRGFILGIFAGATLAVAVMGVLFS